MNDFFSFSSSSFLSSKEEEDIKVMAKRKALLEEMNFDDHPELSLAPSLSTFTDNTYTSSSTESEANSCRKRKMLHTSVELHLNHPLPFDWEQCLDLQSGRVYYMNRETLKRSWSRPKERKVDLELNISRNSSMEEMIKEEESIITTSSMIAVPCFNCHLLVMLCKSSPTCPNCKYVYPLHALQTPTNPSPPPPPPAPKSLETLSLLN
ncbi:WW domain-containing protein [Dioscorea alata]|uniref:WW domain-containing protein n=1 Tax=Dioscorea alata TaxID=55571 RepID=A0ACB7UT86_DIOAL|nr:WW domain-containing protein [Dioscorea alata]